MKDNFEKAVDEVYEAELAEVTEEPKVGFVKGLIAKGKERKEAWTEEHPVAAKRLDIVGKVVKGAALFGTGIFIGNAISKKDEYEVYEDDYPGYDDEVTEEVGTDNE